MIVEGKAKIVVDGVFYNPRMKFCRDLDMLVFSTLECSEMLDALAASGVRGIRAMLEADYTVTFNDRDPKAVEVIRKNLELNGLEAEVCCKEASLLMRERKFEHIDLDPFGSPAHFIDSACFSARKYLSVTATDTSALCGSATGSGLKKYAAFAIKTDTYHETGLRMLIGYVVREATKYEKVALPLISWAKEHYYRVHFRIRRSTSMSSKVYEKVGYLLYCPKCLAKIGVPMQGEVREYCKCGERLVMLGPLWLGEFKDDEFVKFVREKASDKAERFLKKIEMEINSPLTYNLQRLAKRLGVQTPKTSKIIEKLTELGYKASGTHYCGFCIRTNAEIDVIEEVISS